MILCNKYFVTGVFPNDMKIPKVIHLLFKVSILSTCLNIAIVSGKITIYFVKSISIMDNSQYGIREDRSTNLALMQLFEEITTNIDINLVTAGVFTDLKRFLTPFIISSDK